MNLPLSVLKPWMHNHVHGIACNLMRLMPICRSDLRFVRCCFLFAWYLLLQFDWCFVSRDEFLWIFEILTRSFWSTHILSTSKRKDEMVARERWLCLNHNRDKSKTGKQICNFSQFHINCYRTNRNQIGTIIHCCDHMVQQRLKWIQKEIRLIFWNLAWDFIFYQMNEVDGCCLSVAIHFNWTDSFFMLLDKLDFSLFRGLMCLYMQ